MLLHIFNQVYVLRPGAMTEDVKALQEKSIQTVISLIPRQWPPGLDIVQPAHVPGEALALGDVTALAAVIREKVSAGCKVAVCWPEADDSPLLVVLHYLIHSLDMSLANAFVLVADRLRALALDAPLLPSLVQSSGVTYPENRVRTPRFFFDMLSAASSTPSAILPDLYLGSLVALGNQAAIRALGIKAVLRVDHLEGRSPLQWEEDFTLLDLPIQDGRPITADTLRQGVAFIHNQRMSERTVLVHCIGGVSRSVTLTLAYMIEHLGLNLADAYARIVRSRAVARPHGQLWQSLVQYYDLPYTPQEANAEDFPDRLLEMAAIRAG